MTGTTYDFAAQATLEAGRVRSFGDSAAESAALKNGCVTVPLLGTTALRVSGADRLDFLHGQVSNEVRRLEPAGYRDALLLNHRGHALAQLRVLRLEDALIAVVEGGAGAFVQGELEAHIIFDAVDLTRLDDVTFSVQGTSAGEVLGRVFRIQLPSENRFAMPTFEGEQVLLSPARRSAQGGYDLTVPAGAATALFEHLTGAGAQAAGERALETARVLAGIADAEHEGGEGVLPQEAGLEHLVSYTKGCYLGQEIMARIEARGTLRRGLVGLRLGGLPDQNERDITADGKTVGRLGTLALHPDLGPIALAVLRKDLEPDSSLAVGSITAHAVTLPFEVAR